MKVQRFELDADGLRPADDGLLPAQAPGTQSYVTNPAAGFSMAFGQYGTVAATPYVPTDQRLEAPRGSRSARRS